LSSPARSTSMASGRTRSSARAPSPRLSPCRPAPPPRLIS
jgi:hypothetical protein